MNGIIRRGATTQADAREQVEMKAHPHCYHVDFAHETETCCWCSGVRKLDFGQGQFDLDVGTATPLVSIWWWRYNPKMMRLYRHVMDHPGTAKTEHGPHRIADSLSVEYPDEEPCSSIPVNPCA
jgi:hypothetical protein